MGCAGSKPSSSSDADNEKPGSPPTPTNLSPEQTLSQPPNDSGNHPSALGNRDRMTQRRQSAGGRSVTETGYHSDVKKDDRFQSRHISLQRITAGDAAFELLMKKYDIGGGQVLGKGACGQVVAVTNRLSGESFAMKKVSADQMGMTLQEITMELDVQKLLDHPNICKILESFVDVIAKDVYIVMEQCTGGSLAEKLTKTGPLDEATTATLTDKMLSAVLYCHMHGVIHRDIKLDNFLYESNTENAELKLIDFGFAAEATKTGDENMSDILGTPSYMSPELWMEVTYDSSVDMWAIGVTVFMMLSCKRPFHHNDPNQKKKMICTAPLKFPSPKWDEISLLCKDFISKLMEKQPAARLSASAARNHPWITKTSTRLSASTATPIEMFTSSFELFAQKGDLAKLALEVIAFTTAPAKLKELRDSFMRIDTDGSGTISLDEFKAAMSSNPNTAFVESLYTGIDVDGSGQLDYTEFLSAMLAGQQQGAGSLRSAFEFLDVDKDGFITRTDLLKATQERLDEESIANLLKQGDAQGRVDYTAFERLMNQGLQERRRSSIKAGGEINGAPLVKPPAEAASPNGTMEGSSLMSQITELSRKGMAAGEQLTRQFV